MAFLLSGFTADAIAHPGTPHIHEGMLSHDATGMMKMKSHKRHSKHCDLLVHSGTGICPHKDKSPYKDTKVAGDCGGHPAGQPSLSAGSSIISLIEQDRNMGRLNLNPYSIKQVERPNLPCSYELPDPPPKSY